MPNNVADVLDDRLDLRVDKDVFAVRLIEQLSRRSRRC